MRRGREFAAVSTHFIGGQNVGFLDKIWGRQQEELPKAAAVPAALDSLLRHSSGLEQFSKGLAKERGLSVLDLGPTSPHNIQYIIGLGHRATSEYLAAEAADPSYLVKREEASAEFDVEAFLRANLLYPEASFDAVFLWDLCDYLPETLVRPVIERLMFLCRPGALMLGFFHTREAGAEAPFYRYNIASEDSVTLIPVEGPRLMRTFANRHIEKLFNPNRSIKFFLGKDNMREVLIIR